YDLFMEKPEPLAERKLRKAVAERINAQGEILTALDEDELVAAGQELADAGVEAIAVCFLHSYANPVHEQRAADLLEGRFSVRMTVSTVFAPEIREYDRGCAVAANAYVLPLMLRYITELHEKLQVLGLKGPLNVMLTG